MEKDIFAHLLAYADRIAEPDNLFSGRRLPPGFIPPDNILVFFHNFTAPAPNSHSRCTFVIPLDCMTYYVDGTQQELVPGTILFVPPHAIRFLHQTSEGYRRLFITFDDPGEQGYLPRPGLGRLTDEPMRGLWRFLDRYRRGTVEDCSLALMNFLRRIQMETGNSDLHVIPAPLTSVLEMIESNLSSGIGIKEIASHVHLSESHLRTLFRKEMGISLGRFLVRKRLDAAQYQLLHSTMTLKEIASACGFANVYVFGAFFKKNAGIPPLKFRNQKPCRGMRSFAFRDQSQA